MKTIRLGHTGIPVSSLCLGAMYLGTRTDESASFHLLDVYVEAGGAFIDTANIYAHWIEGFKGYESEQLLGRWLKARKNRDKLFIATKVGFEIPPYGVERGLKSEQIIRECEKSLKNLAIETIDLYYAHCDDQNTPMEETLEAFNSLIKAGKVRTIGASNFMAWRLEETHWTSQINGWSEYCCIQQRFTYLRPRSGTTFYPQLAVNDDLLEYCRHRPITLLAYSALLSGAYTRPDRELDSQYHSPDSQARLEAVKMVAQEKGITVNQVILAWMLNSQPFVLPLIAASTEAQLRENIQALDIVLSQDEMETLNQAGA